uniref:Uncharacterized protein n=1 Tax=Timema tahoe TaxID=61484 RepID=A0A7R9IJM2_9NEOP|nr:unnamed protein product [Timema tahoe]
MEFEDRIKRYKKLPFETLNGLESSDVSDDIKTAVNQDFDKFVERVATFGVLKWGAYPQLVLQLAQFGWQSEMKDYMIYCTSCSTRLSFSAYLKEPDDWTDKIKSSHYKFCRWISLGHAYPEEFVKVPSDLKLIRDRVITRTKALLELGTSLPKMIALEHGALQLIVKNILKVPLTEESLSALILSLCGWGPTTSHNVLSCDFCKRQVGLWNFITIQDEPTLADDYLCILNSPGSCTDEPLSILESSPIQDVDMQLTDPQTTEGSELHEDATEKEESSFIDDQYDYGHYDENQDSCDDENEGSVEQYTIENNDEENLDSDQRESAMKGYQDPNLMIDNINLVPDNFSEQDCEDFPGIEPEDGTTSVDTKVSTKPNLLEGENGGVEILELTSGSEESDGSLEDEEDEEDYPSDDEEAEDEEMYMEEGNIRFMTDEKGLIQKYRKDEESFEDEEEDIEEHCDEKDDPEGEEEEEATEEEDDPEGEEEEEATEEEDDKEEGTEEEDDDDDDDDDMSDGERVEQVGGNGSPSNGVVDEQSNPQTFEMYDSERDGQNSSVIRAKGENETTTNVVGSTMLVYSENKVKGENVIEQILVETQNVQAVVNKPIKLMIEEMEIAVTPNTEVAMNHTSHVDKAENKREVKEINNKSDKACILDETMVSSKDIESESEMLVKSTKETFHYLTNDLLNNDKKTKVFDGPKTLTQQIRREDVEAKPGTAFEKEDSSETTKNLINVKHTNVRPGTSVESQEDLDNQTRSGLELESGKVEQEPGPPIEIETKTCENVPAEQTISNESDGPECMEAESRTEMISKNSTSELEPCLVSERANSEPMEIDKVETACTGKRLINVEEEMEVKTENQNVGDDSRQDVKGDINLKDSQSQAWEDEINLKEGNGQEMKEDINLKDSQSQDVGGSKDIQEQDVSTLPSDGSDCVTKEKEHSVSEESVEKLLVVSGEVDCQHVLDETEDKTETTYSTCNGPVVDMDITGLGTSVDIGANQDAEDRVHAAGQSRKRRRVSTPLPEIDAKRWRMESVKLDFDPVQEHRYWCIWGLPVDRGQEDSLIGWQRVLADLVRYTLQKSTIVSEEETTAEEKNIFEELVKYRDVLSTLVLKRGCSLQWEGGVNKHCLPWLITPWWSQASQAEGLFIESERVEKGEIAGTLTIVLELPLLYKEPFESEVFHLEVLMSLRTATSTQPYSRSALEFPCDQDRVLVTNLLVEHS